jgi:hypothetical protein
MIKADEAGRASGIGIFSVPSQYFQVSLVSKANLTLRRHREYSGPVAFAFRSGTPGRRGEMCGCIRSRLLVVDSCPKRIHNGSAGKKANKSNDSLEETGHT